MGFQQLFMLPGTHRIITVLFRLIAPPMRGFALLTIWIQILYN